LVALLDQTFVAIPATNIVRPFGWPNRLVRSRAWYGGVNDVLVVDPLNFIAFVASSFLRIPSVLKPVSVGR
jgi:hypothetical protein